MVGSPLPLTKMNPLQMLVSQLPNCLSWLWAIHVFCALKRKLYGFYGFVPTGLEGLYTLLYAQVAIL
jgi:hypothetical protein